MLQFTVMMFPCYLLTLLIYLFGLEISSFEVGLTLDVPLLDALDLLIPRQKHLIGE